MEKQSYLVVGDIKRAASSWTFSFFGVWLLGGGAVTTKTADDDGETGTASGAGLTGAAGGGAVLVVLGVVFGFSLAKK